MKTGVLLLLVSGYINLCCIQVTSGHVERKRFLLRTEPCNCFQDCACVQGDCVNNQCRCLNGWGGTDCGLQSNFVSQYMSSTTSGHSGHHTTTNLPRQHHHNEKSCSYHGYQVNGTCVCQVGYTGDICQHRPYTNHECIDPTCNHGICLWWLDQNGDRHQKCHCDDDYLGDNCEYTDTALGLPYLCRDQALCEHGKCFHHRGISVYYYSCQCDNGWHGHHCDDNRTDSEAILCGDKICHHGTCHRYDGNKYTCNCEPGWRGDHCDREEWSHCGSHHCLHGTCFYNKDNRGNTYNHHCVCSHDWHGTSCNHQYSTTTTTAATTPSTVPTTTPSTVPTTTPSTVPTTTPSTVRTTMMVYTATSAPKSTESTSDISTVPHLTKTPTTLGVNNTASTSTTSQTTSYHECNETNVKNGIDNSVKSVNTHTPQCQSGLYESSEAFVIEHCNVSVNTATWRRGQSVATLCNNTTSSLPPYTPIATFDNDLYSSIGSRAAIFVRCLNGGFEMAFQTCSKPPHSTSILNGGIFIQDPSVYFVVI